MLNCCFPITSIYCILGLFIYLNFQLSYLSTNDTDGLCLSQLYRQLLGRQWILIWAMHLFFLYLSRLPRWSVILLCVGCYIEIQLHFNVFCLVKCAYCINFNLYLCSVNQLLLYFFFSLLLLSGKTSIEFGNIVQFFIFMPFNLDELNWKLLLFDCDGWLMLYQFLILWSV